MAPLGKDKIVRAGGKSKFSLYYTKERAMGRRGGLLNGRLMDGGGKGIPN